jgi:hypothetical protein
MASSALVRLLSLQSIKHFSALDMSIETNNKHFGLFIATMDLPHHLINQGLESGTIDNFVLSAAEVSSPSGLDDAAGLLLIEFVDHLGVSIPNHPLLVILMLSVGVDHLCLGFLYIDDLGLLWSLNNWLLDDLGWFFDYLRLRLWSLWLFALWLLYWGWLCNLYLGNRFLGN